MKQLRTSLALLAASATAVGTVMGALALTGPANATEPISPDKATCRGMARLTVPGAEKLEAACLGDLTTAGTTRTGHTDPTNFTGFGGLSVPGTVNPTGVPGIQLDGYFRTPPPSTPPTAGTTTPSS